jgi:hypothetical protein
MLSIKAATSGALAIIESDGRAICIKIARHFLDSRLLTRNSKNVYRQHRSKAEVSELLRQVGSSPRSRRHAPVAPAEMIFNSDRPASHSRAPLLGEIAQEAKAKAARELQSIKLRLKLTNPGAPLKGVKPSPLVATTQQRTAKLVPPSDRIPGAAPKKDLLHAHKWKRGAEETASTVKEMRRKARQIAPAYNKGALQYLPGGR